MVPVDGKSEAAVGLEHVPADIIVSAWQGVSTEFLTRSLPWDNLWHWRLSNAQCAKKSAVSTLSPTNPAQLVVCRGQSLQSSPYCPVQSSKRTWEGVLGHM